MNQHIQKWVKVNEPTDEGVANLVRALARFPCLQTIESCQGSKDGKAWICFKYGSYWQHPWRDLTDFVLGFFGPQLAHKIGDAASVTIYVSESGQIRGELSVYPDAIEQTPRAVELLAHEFLS